MSAARPLEGILVVSLEQAVAAPLATRRLADAGARVVKVERPGGDFARGYDRAARGGSAYFVWLNRGKESVVVDLKDPDDARFLRRLVAAADVLIQNLAPGAAGRAGFGSERLRAEYPRLVTCDISGYGGSGPWADMKAYDNLVQGEAGLQAVTGTPDAPARVGVSVCDIAAGMHAWGAVTEALLRRERTGRGAALQVSLFDAVADWMAVPYLHATYGGGPPPRSGLSHPSIAPYGPFRSAEGDVVLVAVQNEREWGRLCRDVVRRPDLADDARFRDNPSRVAHRDALRPALQEAFGGLTTAEMTGRLRESAVAFGRVNDVEAFAAHPQLRTVEVATAEGRVRLPAEPVVWAEGDGAAAEGRAAADPHAAAWEGADAAADRSAPPVGGGRLDGVVGASGLPRVPALDEHGSALRAEFDFAGSSEAGS